MPKGAVTVAAMSCDGTRTDNLKMKSRNGSGRQTASRYNDAWVCFFRLVVIRTRAALERDGRCTWPCRYTVDCTLRRHESLWLADADWVFLALWS